MAFREVSVVEVRELLRLWLRGEKLRAIGRMSGVHRHTVAAYVEAAQAAGLTRDAGESAISDELIAEVVEMIRPDRRQGFGASWEVCASEREWIEERLGDGLSLTKVHDLLGRKLGTVVPYPTLHRFAVRELGFGRKKTTVRLADGEPGHELQVDFGRMGLLHDANVGRRRVCHALIFTAVVSRHQFVFLTFSQSLESVIAGFEAAWRFFDGVFGVVIPDNVRAIVDHADPVNPRINEAFLEYAQSRGFAIDAARVRHPRDKARVERQVTYVRESMWKGEDLRDLEHAQAHAEHWALKTAGMRIHRTIQARPVEVFREREQPVLLPVPEGGYDLPVYRDAKVHRDCHIEVERALYSVPHALVGTVVHVRADTQLVRIWHKGRVVKVHPRMPRGSRHTDAEDLPSEKQAYAMRDVESLKRMAAKHGPSIGTYAACLLDCDLPWTRMRKVYRLLGLVKRFGAERVELACTRALELDVVDVTRVARILERALEGVPVAENVVGEASTSQPIQPASVATQQPLRFARDASEFSVETTGGAS